jgi:DNA modification methylase
MSTPEPDLRSRSDVSWAEWGSAFLAADWALQDAPRTVGGELHPYPARFISALPGQALDILQPRGSVIDPFCGSGTTLQEAQRRGLQSVGNDLNPIAGLISRVRTSQWRPGDASAATRHAKGLGEAASQIPSTRSFNVDIPRVDHWFEPWAQQALAGAVQYLDTIDKNDPWHDRVALSISSCVVRLSRQESDTRYAAISKSGDQAFAAELMARTVIRVADWLKHHSSGNEATATVLTGDARSFPSIPDSSVAAAIFSPPYPNAYEYWLYHKYRMYWLDEDPIAVRSQEMGARPHYSCQNGLTELDFAVQMTDVFHELKRVLFPEAPVVVVIGDSMIQGREIDNATLLTEAVMPVGFDLIAHCVRPILRRRSSFNSSRTRGRKNEHVLLYRRLP